MPPRKKTDDISREEDFRDYEERDIDDGWPYDDDTGGRPVENAAYGDPAANFDSDRNPGYTVDEADFDGQEERLADSIRPGTKGLEDADDLEERVTEAIDNLAIVDMDSIDVHVERMVVTLEGIVDDAQTSRRIAHRVGELEGVRRVVNNIRLAGVDSRIPDED